MLADLTWFYSSSGKEESRNPGEGAGKKHLITGVPLLVTRRWQRLPGFQGSGKGVFRLEARGPL